MKPQLGLSMIHSIHFCKYGFKFYYHLENKTAKGQEYFWSLPPKPGRAYIKTAFSSLSMWEFQVSLAAYTDYLLAVWAKRERDIGIVLVLSLACKLKSRNVT